MGTMLKEKTGKPAVDMGNMGIEGCLGVSTDSGKFGPRVRPQVKMYLEEIMSKLLKKQE